MEEYGLCDANWALILISGALCWSVQVVAGIKTALIAGRGYLLLKGQLLRASLAVEPS